MLYLSIATRYLFARKSTQDINIISGIAALGVAVGCAALIIILSVFNGFEGLIVQSYQRTAPEVLVLPKNGKYIQVDSVLLKKINAIDGVKRTVTVLKDNALLRFGQAQYFATLKGVSANYTQNAQTDSVLEQGYNILQEGNENYALLSLGVQYGLNVNIEHGAQSISVYAPKANVVAGTVLNPESYFNRAEILPVGIFSLKNEQDEKLMIVPLRFAQSLYGKPSGITEIEVYGLTESNGKVLKERLSGLLGGDYILQNRYEQNATLYKVLNIERWAVYVILTFILLIAACNIIASVTILVAEKQKNIATLIAMGAYYGHIRQIFLFTGSLIGLIGGSIGIVLGLVVCLVQQHYGFISVGNGSSSQAYPVILHVSDFILVFFTLIIISTTTGYITARQVKNVS